MIAFGSRCFWHFDSMPRSGLVQPLLERYGIRSRVTLLGQVSAHQVRAALWSGHALVLPSLAEAFGVVLLEALSTGIPVIATDTGGIPEIIENGKEGFLIRPGNSGELEQAVMALYEDPIGCRRMANAGIEKARAFSVEAMLKKIKRLYLGLHEVSASG